MISIIITAYKEANLIGKSIEAVLRNKLTNYEILVLAPDEETLNIGRLYASKNKNIHVIKDKGEGKPSALNLAFKLAKGEILILTDGDVYINNNAIPFMLKKFENQQTRAVTGRPISINNRKTMLGFWSHLLTDVADKRRKKAKEIKRRIFAFATLEEIAAPK